MLSVNILWEGGEFRLPDEVLEGEIPRLRMLHKGIMHIFKPVLREFPGHEILVIWDEDLQTLLYESPTLPKEKIREVLTASHGNLFNQ